MRFISLSKTPNDSLNRRLSSDIIYLSSRVTCSVFRMRMRPCFSSVLIHPFIMVVVLLLFLLLDHRLAFGHPPLTRLEPFELGHERTIALPEIPSRSVSIKTLNVDPPIFAIENFLLPNECQHIIRLAQNAGLETSQAGEPVNDDVTMEDSDYEEAWKAWDTDGDAQLTRAEIVDGMREFTQTVLTEDDVERMFNELGMDENGDGTLDFDEFKNANINDMDGFLDDVEESRPVFKTRYSRQAWLNQGGQDVDVVLETLRERLLHVTGLPRVVVETSESLQVVHYDHRGHYHCHMDSDHYSPSDNMTCCHFDRRDETLGNGRRCALCRYLTLLYYLNDVTLGGATAFPFAHANATFQDSGPEFQRLCNLSAQCDSGVVVTPKMGTAVLWYSHRLDDGGQIGEIDLRTYHGGCDVLDGEKWIANNWIDVDATENFYTRSERSDSEYDTQTHSEL